MVENRPLATFFAHLVLILGAVIVTFPILFTLLASTYEGSDVASGRVTLWPGTMGLENYWLALTSGARYTAQNPAAHMLLNSAIMAVTIAVGKIFISLLSAFAVVYFRFPGRMLCFWVIFLTLMLPVEVRILPTYKVISDLGMLDSYAGLTVPLIASATATLLFRQFFMTVPPELAEAAKIDGAGPLKFFWDILMPLSVTNIAALFVILFIYGWNQYLWPLLITTSGGMDTVVIGMKKMIGGDDTQTDWGVVMATTILAMLPPIVIIVVMQRWFVKGLVEQEK
ncbi:sn-glycerol-3-phosphate transport system permease protein UgpE [Elstera cyanobacteriorum]|uniref:sn-glycerol-3-phosphate transport system permease protein UgpE n=1 Tax=Elstera cyanobacteriorum TaxID=2022747 RepID=A0A255XUB1_9PROT|nr:sn-glycerol-3-phosphate ABC transporter permease UgpE [Elstera cyanobacteriorum]OYQ19830.1 glycerol-3-phosphate transporter [Elstera cyanobacteriorum]GFZ95880.1 sn-glycerol-3-phosphate transport system permease protein UgpE [Elstera cyanobacteriorum]